MVLDADRPLSLLELEELRIAADEACILIMDNCGPQQGTVDCCFDELADGIVMDIRAATDTARRAPPWIDVDSFGWTLPDALVDSLFWEADATESFCTAGTAVSPPLPAFDAPAEIERGADGLPTKGAVSKPVVLQSW